MNGTAADDKYLTGKATRICRLFKTCFSNRRRTVLQKTTRYPSRKLLARVGPSRRASWMATDEPIRSGRRQQTNCRQSLTTLLPRKMYAHAALRHVLHGYTRYDQQTNRTGADGGQLSPNRYSFVIELRHRPHADPWLPVVSATQQQNVLFCMPRRKRPPRHIMPRCRSADVRRVATSVQDVEIGNARRRHP